MIAITAARDLIAQAGKTEGAEQLGLFIDAALAKDPDATMLDVTVTVETLDDVITAIHIR